MALKLRFWRLLGALGRLLGASWFPRAANMVARASQGGSKSGYLVDFRWILMQILHRFINKFPGMSVTGPRRKTQLSCKRATAQDTLCLAREPRPPGKVGLLIWLSLVADRWVCLLPFTPSHMCKEGRRYVRSTGNFLAERVDDRRR